jgi:DNA-binding NarL/FixJ family response regulator
MKNKFKVFIVEDSMEISQRLKTMLTELDGIEVVGQAVRSREAGELIPKLNPHAVILDGRLPDENGIELLKKIKKNNVALKVIIFSNETYNKYREKCLAMGADFYFNKATEFEMVPKTITSWAQEFFRAELPASPRSGD